MTFAAQLAPLARDRGVDGAPGGRPAGRPRRRPRTRGRGRAVRRGCCLRSHRPRTSGRSEPQTPTASTRTRHSPACGRGTRPVAHPQVAGAVQARNAHRRSVVHRRQYGERRSLSARRRRRRGAGRRLPRARRRLHLDRRAARCAARPRAHTGARVPAARAAAPPPRCPASSSEYGPITPPQLLGDLLAAPVALVDRPLRIEAVDGDAEDSPARCSRGSRCRRRAEHRAGRRPRRSTPATAPSIERGRLRGSITLTGQPGEIESARVKFSCALLSTIPRASSAAPKFEFTVVVIDTASPRRSTMLTLLVMSLAGVRWIARLDLLDRPLW